MNFPTGETFTYQAEDSETKVGKGNVILHFCKRTFVLGIVYRIGQKTWDVFAYLMNVYQPRTSKSHVDGVKVSRSVYCDLKRNYKQTFVTNVKDKLFIEEQRFKTPVISSSIMIIFIITI